MGKYFDTKRGGFWLMLLSLLGFVTLPRCGMYAPPPHADMYGSPYAEFRSNVKAVNSAGDGIEGLEVQAAVTPQGHSFKIGTTDANGMASELEWSGAFSDSLRLKIIDTDGAANGHYKDTLVRVKIDDADWKDKGDGDWNTGTVEKDVTVVMTKK